MKKELEINVTTDGERAEYLFHVEVFTYVDDNGEYIAYCPSLDINAAGDTSGESESEFYDQLLFRIWWRGQKKSLLDYLSSIGWEKGTNGLEWASTPLPALMRKRGVRHMLARGRKYETHTICVKAILPV